MKNPQAVTAVGKNKTMTFNLASQSPPVIAKSVAQEPLDSWDNNAVQYHKSYANATSFGNSPYAYGINDMNYYGSFINAGGCGLHVATVLHQRQLGSVWEWSLGLLSERRLFLGISLSVGLDPVPLR